MFIVNNLCMVTKTISIKEDHATWLKEKTINLSRFVQKHIDEAMNDEK